MLGGGGVTGIGWTIGLLAGLAERGVVLAGGDLVVGTSAGSVAGVHVAAGVDLAESYERQLEPPTDELRPRPDMVALGRLGVAFARSRSGPALARRIGRVAVSARTVPEGDRIDVINSRLPVHAWPATPLKVTAVDCETGELIVFDAASGVPLADAVAASCAVPGVWPPVTINGRRYMDGGMVSAAHAGLASECERVVVIAPLGSSVKAIADPSREVRALREGGAQVVLVTPDAESRAAAGRNALDPSRRAGSARCGYAQAEAEAERIAAIW